MAGPAVAALALRPFEDHLPRQQAGSQGKSGCGHGGGRPTSLFGAAALVHNNLGRGRPRSTRAARDGGRVGQVCVSGSVHRGLLVRERWSHFRARSGGFQVRWRIFSPPPGQPAVTAGPEKAATTTKKCLHRPPSSRIIGESPLRGTRPARVIGRHTGRFFARQRRGEGPENIAARRSLGRSCERAYFAHQATVIARPIRHQRAYPTPG